LLFEVSMENLDGRLMRDRLAANSSVSPHRHREGCEYQKDALFFGLEKNSGTSPSPRWANEPPHLKLCRYCQNIFDHWPAPDTCNWGRFEFLRHGNELELKMCAENDCSLCAQFVLGFDRLTLWERLRPYKYGRKQAKITEGLASLRVDDDSRDGDYYDKGLLTLSLLIPSTRSNGTCLAYYVHLSLSPKQG
jgi:hypothetical protein